MYPKLRAQVFSRRVAVTIMLLIFAVFTAPSFARGGGGGGHGGGGFHSSSFHSSSSSSSGSSWFHSSSSSTSSAAPPPTRPSFGGFGARPASTPIATNVHQPVLTSSLTQSSAHQQALATHDARNAGVQPASLSGQVSQPGGYGQAAYSGAPMPQYHPAPVVINSGGGFWSSMMGSMTGSMIGNALFGHHDDHVYTQSAVGSGVQPVQTQPESSWFRYLFWFLVLILVIWIAHRFYTRRNDINKDHAHYTL